MIRIYKEHILYTVKHNIAAAVNKISESNATEIVNYMIWSPQVASNILVLLLSLPSVLLFVSKLTDTY